MKPSTFLFTAALLMLLGCNGFAQDKLTAEKVIAASVAAVGSPESRAQLTYYELGGKAKMRTSTRSVSAEGTAILVSEKNQVKLKTAFDSAFYSGDQVVYDGKEVLISKDRRGGHSPFGDFLFNQPKIVSDGLLGGVLSTAWPLFDEKMHGAKIEYDGLKKVDGVQLHQLTYTPRKSSERLTVHLYFDKEFRHVKSVYEFNAPGRNAAKGRNLGAESTENTFVLEENFGGFLKIAGLTLPTHHSFSYSSTAAELGRWNFDLTYDDLNGTKLPAVE